MPAPLPSGTVQPEKDRFWIVQSASTVRMALPFGGWAVATRFTMPPTPMIDTLDPTVPKSFA